MSTIPDDEKLVFSLHVNKEGVFLAFAEGAPLFAEGRTLQDLRHRMAAAVRAFFGREVRTALLVGMPSPPPEPVSVQ